VTRRAWAVARYRLAPTLRRHWSGYLSVILLVGLVGGVSLASFQAARRTQSSYPTFLAGTNPSDVVLAIYSPNGAPLPSILSKVEQLPEVRHVETAYIPHVLPLTTDGAARISILSHIQFVASLDGLYSNQDHLTIIAGRAAEPNSDNELVLDPDAARLLGVHVGEILPMGIFTQAEGQSPGFGTARVQPKVRLAMHVVGIGVENNEVIQDDVDRAFGFGYFTPALEREVLRVAPSDNDTPVAYGLQLTGGAADVPTVESEVRSVLPPNGVVEFHVTSRTETAVAIAMRPMSFALGGFAIVAALACLLLGMQAISRLLRDDDDDRAVLRILGATRVATVADGLFGASLAIVAGTAVAIGVAAALSPLSPLGPVRSVYPDRGVAVDGTVDLLGAAVLLVALGFTALVLAIRSNGRRPSRVPRPSSVARGVEAAGLPLTCAVGVRFALEPGVGRTAVPLRSVLFGTVVAVALVVTTLTFASSFQTLVSNPPLYGWNWSYALLPTNGLPLSSAAMLDHDPVVAGWTGTDYNIVTIDGLAVPVLIEHGDDDAVNPPVLSGHGVREANQIVLGGTTLAALHRRIGQTVEVSYGSPSSAPVYFKPTAFTIVGTATFPAIGYSSLVADHTSMGVGGLFSQSDLPRAFIAIVSGSDPNLGGPELAFVRLRPGVSPSEGHQNLEQLAARINRIYDKDPRAAGNDVVVLGVQRPAQIVNYRTMGDTPVVLAIGLAVGALAALALTLTASVRRRRRDLALMKALGFTPRQLAAAVAWQSTVSAVIGVAIGMPLGVVLGRQLWTLFARGLQAVPDPTVPTGTLVLVALGTVVFAILVALLPGRAAGRTPTAVILRAD
jgi:FtsX-like permease family